MPSTFLTDCDSEVAQRFRGLHDAFVSAYPGWTMPVVCTYRSPDEQFALYQHGRMQGADEKWFVTDSAQVLTDLDGIHLRSFHNDKPARAVDVEIHSPDGRKCWNYEDAVLADGMANPWFWYRDNAPRFGILCGGSWKTLHDWPHVQLA